MGVLPKPNRGPLVENVLADDAWARYLFRQEKNTRSRSQQRCAVLMDTRREARERSMSRSAEQWRPAPQECPMKPNKDCYATQNRFGRCTMVTQDNRGKILSRVFLDGRWVYVA
eukprot:g5833.t1